mgnify:CR=1 FL=1
MIKSFPKSNKNQGLGKLEIENEVDRRTRIAVSAYYKAQARGFEPGHDVDDWLSAEAEEKNEQLTF